MKIYSAAELYEKAFSYRDIAAEVQFLLDVYGKFHNGKLPVSALEIACGPARHALEMCRYISNIHALDNSSDMLALAAFRARVLNCPSRHI